MNKLIESIIPNNLRNLRFIAHFRIWLNYRFKLRKRLLKQLSYHKKIIPSSSQSSKRIFIPIIETNHYLHLQLLIFAKALELHGARVKVLICGQFLEGCEIKSVRNQDDSDPCFVCRFNEKNLLPIFNLDIIRLDDIILQKERNQFQIKAERLVESGDSIMHHGIELNRNIKDSVIRYYYGDVPDDEAIVKSVRINHAMTAMNIAVHEIVLQRGTDFR